MTRYPQSCAMTVSASLEKNTLSIKPKECGTVLYNSRAVFFKFNELKIYNFFEERFTV